MEGARFLLPCVEMREDEKGRYIESIARHVTSTASVIFFFFFFWLDLRTMILIHCKWRHEAYQYNVIFTFCSVFIGRSSFPLVTCAMLCML